MQPRYNSRKFHRSPRMQPHSPQALPLNSVISSKQYMSPIVRNHSDSFDEGYQYQQNETAIQPTFNSIVERLTQLQIVVREDKSQRLDQHTKLIKMIKEMQCKHSSIIYDTEIKYNKFAFRPELYSTLNSKQTRNEGESTIKKVSSYIFQKNLPVGKNQPVSSTVKSLKKSDVEISKKTETFNQLSKASSLTKQNPEKKYVTVDQQQQSGLFNTQQSQMQILALERKIQEDQNKKLQKMQEEVTSLINKKVQQLKQSIKQSQTKLTTKISSSIPKQANISPVPTGIENNLTLLKQSTSEQLSKHSAQITKHTSELAKMSTHLGSIFDQLTKQSQSFSTVYSELTQHSNQLAINSNQLSNLSNQLIKQENQLARQENDLNMCLSQTNLNNGSSAQIQKIYTELTGLQNFVRNNSMLEMSKFQSQIQRAFTLIYDLSNPLRQRMTQVDQILNQHNQQLHSLKKANQNDHNNLNSRITQIQTYFLRKIQENQSQIGNTRQQQMKLAQQFDIERSRRINQQIQSMKKKQQQQKKNEEKLNNQLVNKIEQTRVELLKQLQSYHKIVENQVVGVIEKHIEYIESYLKNVEDKQSYLYNKFINSTTDSADFKTNTRVTGGIKLTGNQKFLHNSSPMQASHGGVGNSGHHQMIMS